MAEGDRSGRAALAVAAVFAALGLLGLAFHEMWRDELEIWLIARDSAGPLDLLRNMGTEGHPALWYAVNFLLSRLTRSPLALQLASLTVGTGAAYLFFRHAPFGLAQRLLFCFGYYLLFEYTVISRAYGLELLLLFGACALCARRGRLGAGGAALLALLAHTHLFGAIMAGALALYFALRAARREAAERAAELGASAVAALSAAVALGHVWVQGRAIGPDHAGAFRPGWDLGWLADGIGTVFRGTVPLPDPATLHPWNTNLVDLLPPAATSAAAGLLGLGILAAMAFSLRRRPLELTIFGLGVLGFLGFLLVFWHGYTRQHGQFFVWFLACSWLGSRPGGATAEETSSRGPRALRPPWPGGGSWVTALLVLQLAAGLTFLGLDARRPFSNARAVARFLERPELASATLVGSIDYAAQPVAGYLDRPIWYPEQRRFGTFMDWSRRRKMVPVQAAVDQALELMRAGRGPVVLVLSHPFEGLAPGDAIPVATDARMLLLARFTGAIVADENYHVFRLVPREQPETEAGPS